MGTRTQYLNLYKPTERETGWADEVNENFTIIDTLLSKALGEVSVLIPGDNIQDAINTGHSVVFTAGTYPAVGLTQDADGQCFYAIGDVRIQKNGNGVILTSTGDNVQLHGIKFYGDSDTPVYTGDNLNFSGDNVQLNNCGSRWASGRAVKATGQHVQIINSCDIYETTDQSASGYDIELGLSGVATLYHQIANIYSSTSWGGIKTTDTGSLSVVGSQFGKLTVTAGTLPAGCNGGHYVANRILGDVTIGVANSEFAGNQFGAVAITFAAGTSGHTLDESNGIQSGATITNDASTSYITDLRDVPVQNYTPAWTALTVAPDIGNGIIAGTKSKQGQWVTATIYVDMGSTTTFGTGAWYFSLPFIPVNNVPYVGSAMMFVAGTAFYIGVVTTLTDGTARCVLWANGAADNIKSTIPATWASGDYLRLTLRYAAEN